MNFRIEIFNVKCHELNWIVNHEQYRLLKVLNSFLKLKELIIFLNLDST